MKKGGFLLGSALLVSGIFLGIAAMEAGLRLKRGAPPREPYDENFYWAYINIYDDFYAKDSALNAYVSRRLRSKSSRFGVQKAAGEKRVFIIGESVAFLFEEDVLRKKLKEALPSFDWKVFNCGMGGYDSYRILRIAREVPKYKPDLVILLMEHNDGYHNPVRINHLKYRYPVLARFWVTRMLTDYLAPAVRLNGFQEAMEQFETGLTKITEVFEKKDIPLVVCTLPLNHAVPFELSDGDYRDREYFAVWRLLEKNPEKLKRSVAQKDRWRFSYYLARACDRTGDRKAALGYYANNRTKIDRIGKITQLAQRSGGKVILSDINRLVMEMGGGSPGFEFFHDSIHFWPPMYELISDEIVKAVFDAEKQGYTHLAGRPDEWRMGRYVPSDPKAVLAAGRKTLDVDYYQHFGGMVLNVEGLGTEFKKELLRNWLRINPGMVLRFRDEKSRVLEPVTERKEEKWNQCLALVGEALREEGYDRESLAYLDEAIAADDRNELGYLFRGLWHYDRGRRRDAEKDFGELKRIQPQYDWLSVKYLESLERT
ncbi:MAG: SGNH/GDSL hydrolase family protein [Endomicrobiales bacterium]